MISNLSEFLSILREEGDLVEISAPVSHDLEAAEIHRRVIAEGGPALLFTNITGASFSLATNLFGTAKRVELAFGKRPENLIRQIAKLPETLMPPTLSRLWGERALFADLVKVGLKRKTWQEGNFIADTPPRLSRLPLLKTWKQDGGPFITLPLVYTEHPETGIPNLGMYRMQRYNDDETGLHCQIGKGGGFHLHVAKQLGEKLPVNVFLGGPPALVLSAIAPLPENVPELLLASLVLGERLPLLEQPFSKLPAVSSAEFVLVGECDPAEMRPEGPFGDHYGYYSLKHDYPVFRCKALLRKARPICPATVVGKPKQEDFFLGDYLQELLSPVFPIVMPTVKDLWSYGETGYHSLATAVVQERYKREAMVSAFRILGEGQLSLTKFLLVVDRSMNIRDFRSVLQYILERADFRSDLYVFSNLSMDTLDYTGPEVNKGSKGVLLGIGDPIRELPTSFSGDLPRGISHVAFFCPGCLVVSGTSYAEEPTLAERIASHSTFAHWPLIILADNSERTASSESYFLWQSFTRFEPGADIYCSKKTISRNHLSYEAPIVIDTRMKPDYPDELECDPETEKLVDNRWREYFPR
ncbi:MAG: UbiD family decarboxylase [Bdellovibrionales bacterium]|nr:UbiD family decarboxylase [Bdellovibrionales bacterium]